MANVHSEANESSEFSEANETKVDLVGVGLNTADTVMSLSHYPERAALKA